jgi:hypothetical protein
LIFRENLGVFAPWTAHLCFVRLRLKHIRAPDRLAAIELIEAFFKLLFFRDNPRRKELANLLVKCPKIEVAPVG